MKFVSYTLNIHNEPTMSKEKIEKNFNSVGVFGLSCILANKKTGYGLFCKISYA